MNAKPGGDSTSKAAAVVSIGKDGISFLRDATLFLLAVMLLAFPATFNKMLVNAGFVEGSVVGFKWESHLVNSQDALETANDNIQKLKEQNKTLLATLTELNGESGNSDKDARVTALTAQSEELANTTKAAQDSVEQAIKSNSQLVEKALVSINNAAPYKTSDYWVGLQTLGFPDSERVDLEKKLSAQGYQPYIKSANYAERPTWFAGDPTVFYYSVSSRIAAEGLASFLQGVTGQVFAVKWGSGFGVPPDKRSTLLYVHYSKE